MAISTVAPAVSQSLGSIPSGPCFSSRYFKISKWVSFLCDASALQSGTSALVLSQVSLRKGPLRANFPFSVVCGFLRCISCWFSKPGVWGLIAPVQDPGVGEPPVELEPLAPQRRASPFVILGGLWIAVAVGFLLARPRLCLPAC